LQRVEQRLVLILGHSGMMVMRDARTPIERGAHCGLAIGQAQQWQTGDQRSDA
jgi:hypothetical protein